MELACDEAAIGTAPAAERADYCESILRFATVRQMPGALAFGQGQVAKRVAHLLKYRKPAPLLLALGCVLVALGCGACALRPQAETITPQAERYADQQRRGTHRTAGAAPGHGRAAGFWLAGGRFPLHCPLCIRLSPRSGLQRHQRYAGAGSV